MTAWLALSPGPTAPSILANDKYLVGDGWGCALVSGNHQATWECWETVAGGPTTPVASIPAWRAPLPVRHSFVGGPDRICRMEGEEIRCFSPPRRGEAEPRPFVPGAGPAAPPSAAAVDSPLSHNPSSLDESGLYPGLVGGSFACPGKENDIWCAGDDSFGQLGNRNARGPNPPLLKLWIAEHVGLGTWHGCAWKGGGPPKQQGLFCWGRGDAGQLGVPAPDICQVRGKDVACARRPIRVPLDFRLTNGRGYAPNRGRSDLRGGDLFSCARRGSGASPGIVCWGASRDRLFGDPSLCPPELAGAWPLLRGGTIAAPAAACSPAPVVIAGSDRFKRYLGSLYNGAQTSPPEVTDNFDVGPRGICMVSEKGELWCKGAIATPRGLTVKSVVVNPGDEASACALAKDGRLFCWGEGYSPVNARDRAVPIAFEPIPPPPPPPINPNPAPVDSPVGQYPWGATCRIHRPCGVVARSIPACPAGAQGISAEAAAALPTAGATVSVQGPLRTGSCGQTLVFCQELDPATQKPLAVQPCCNGSSCPIVVGEGKMELPLAGVGCGGDESRVCCDLVANGQMVVATGKLLPNPGPRQDRSPYKLGNPQICSVGAGGKIAPQPTKTDSQPR